MSSKVDDDHHVLGGGGPTNRAGATTSSQPAGTKPPDPRAAALAAAETRARAAEQRGTHASNPKRGQLAAKANKPAKFTPEPQQEQQLVVRSCHALYYRNLLRDSSLIWQQWD
ncbi:hypothetical protein FISHEDRAFT_69562 [Fistulina hepatica ATCC 64428]|uniref:Uncharacterized protein n=1 Tax=Fistulina hepatica ATCC 64428 TaxID=1128425 RepID=A0A0D7APN9_9AGAR|nr:hypothetical protein FISHEDRAFT_69562 [Fistulina hepatica ATCC 64428]